IAAGVRNSVLFEIEEYISRWCNISRQHKVIVTGGDADFLVNSIKSSIFVNSNLVAIGLKRILELNA
ncbi:MAG TPA: type III pantothenate kinase, partial [Bacteroidales bacterium]|nr:type III pantothenate kinase [Bacteroidales bacterium]